MTIFILEDDFVQQSRIEAVVQKMIVKHGLSPQTIEVFGKPNQLFQAIKERGVHQVFFLDIEIKTAALKGFEVAKQIREQDPYAIIVFVTTHSEWMPLAFRYQVSALDYIDKELNETEFESRIEAALLYARDKNSKTVAEDSFYFKSKFAQIQYPFEEVYYIETSSHPHRVILHTKTDRMEFTATLADILKQEKRFIQCHRSFIINPHNVIKIDKQEKILYFPRGYRCLVSRKKMEVILREINHLHRSMG